MNTGFLIPLIQRIRRELPEKDIWSWTGYTWEELMLETPDKLEMLSLIDILVDGRFDITKRTSCCNLEALLTSELSMFKSLWLLKK